MITEKQMETSIKQAKEQYEQIHPKWVYFLLLDVWEKYQNLRKRKPISNEEMKLLEDIHQNVKKLYASKQNKN